VTRFAVTGASGFIATQLISDLLEAGHEVSLEAGLEEKSLV
jgi:uncharacterized protein YbjT (DUF2867 family)